jgi:hypothetical protein
MFETLTNRTDGGALRCLGGGHACARGGEERGNSARYDMISTSSCLGFWPRAIVPAG